MLACVRVHSQGEITMLDIDRVTLHKLYQTMVRIRMFEQRIMELFQQGRLPGFLHVSFGLSQRAAAARCHGAAGG